MYKIEIVSCLQESYNVGKIVYKVRYTSLWIDFIFIKTDLNIVSFIHTPIFLSSFYFKILMYLNNHWNSLPVVYKSEKQMKDTLLLPQTKQISTTKLSECGMSFWSPDNCNWSLVQALKFRSNLLQVWMFIKGLRHDFT